jgi:NADH:ubiquinone oxidoreductase subunit 6 (subunit J)
MLIYESVFAAALVVSAFLALHIDETVYAVISFGTALTLLSALYFFMDAPFAAIFQLLLAVGALAVFLLAGEMLTPKSRSPQRKRENLAGLLVAVALAAIPVLSDLHIEVPNRSSRISFAQALWELRALDVIAQSIVILTLALGILTILKRRGGRRRLWST